MSFFDCIQSLFSVFKAGNPLGNIPSPRYDIPDVNVLIKSTVANSNSMEPLLDIGHTILLRRVLSENDIKVGDIIIYKHEDRSIIHSVIEIGLDPVWYCRTQGLNLYKPDPWKIRFYDVEYLCLGVLWTDKFSTYVPDYGD